MALESHSSRFGILGGEVQDYVLDALFGSVGKHVEFSITCMFGCEWIGFLPLCVDVAVKVCSGSD